MEGFQIGCLLKTFTVCYFPLLLMLALPLVMDRTTLMPTMWHTLNGALEGPASAFLLLNCLIFTIIASSKLEGETRGRVAGESKSEVAMGLIERLAADESKGDNIVIGRSHYSDTQVKNDHIKNGSDYHEVKGEIFVRRSRSLNASFDYKPKHEQVKLNFLNEKKPILKRGRIASSRRNDKVGLHPNKPLSTNLKEKQLSSESSHVEKPPQANNFDNTAVEKCTEGLGRAGPQAQNPVPAAATAHPSSEEVWAAIMSSNKQAAPNSQNVKQPQPPAAAATGTPMQPATAEAVPAAAANSAGKASVAAAAEKHVEEGNDEENDGELEELNRRAEEFITRFNRQMRLQREESLQRQKRGRRACNYDVQYPHPLQLPVRGLLVG